MRYRPRTYAEILASMRARFVALSSLRLSFRRRDFIDSILRAAAIEDDDAHTQMVLFLRSRAFDGATGDELAQAGRFFGLSFREAAAATGTSVVIYRDTAAAPDTEVVVASSATPIVPTTRLASAIEFRTAADLVLAAPLLDLGSTLSPGATSLTVDATFTIPTGVTVTAVVDPGGAHQETVTIASVVGTTVTLSAATTQSHADGEVLALNVSNSVAVTAVRTGAAGNVAVGAITDFQTLAAGVSRAYNITATSGGRDRETDDEFRARLREYPQTLTRATAPALEAAARAVTYNTQSVLGCKSVPDFVRDRVRIYIDDGSGVAATVGPTVALGSGQTWTYTAVGNEMYLRVTAMTKAGSGCPDPGFPLVRPSSSPDPDGPASAPFTVTSSVDGALTLNTDYYLDELTGRLNFVDGAGASRALAAGEVITISAATYIGGLVQQVQKTIVGVVPEDRANFPGFASAGERVRVQSVTATVAVNVTADVTVDDTHSAAEVILIVKSRLQTYLDTRDVGEPVYRARLYEIAMGVPGMVDFAMSLPSTNVLPAVSERAIAGTMTIS